MEVSSITKEELEEFRRYDTAQKLMLAVFSRLDYRPLAAQACGCGGEKINPYEGIAKRCVQVADALISELKKQEGEK